MRVALLFNERPSPVPSDVPSDMFEEYDDMETVQHIARALGMLGVTVELVPADHDLPDRLRDGHYAMAFNIAEGPVDLSGGARRGREALPLAACDQAGIPSTGSDVLALTLTLDKARTRRALSGRVPVAAAVLFDAPEREWCDDAPRFVMEKRALARLAFPVMVKPNDEGSSKGIHAHNVVADARSALQQVRALQSAYHCPVLVEEFLPGTEVTVAIAGNGRDARVLGMMEVAPKHFSERFVYSLEAKRDYRQYVTYHVPPRLPERTRRAIGAHALTAFRLLGCRDIARMDFRLDKNDQPCFLECNALPGLHPEHGDIVILSRHTLPYEQLVQGILIDAAIRNGIALPARGAVA